jgi:hypothetical protein
MRTISLIRINFLSSTLFSLLVLGLMAPALFSNAQTEAEGMLENMDISEALILTVQNARVEAIDSEDASAVIRWETNMPSQGVVVCGMVSGGPYTLDIESEHLGYQWSTLLASGYITVRRMPLAGLAAGPRVCRAASRLGPDAPWVVSEEIAFSLEERSLPTATEQGMAITVEDVDTNEGEHDDQVVPAVSGSFAGGIFSLGECALTWWVWLLLLGVLFYAIYWPKEYLTGTGSTKTLPRLYILPALGAVGYAVALVFGNGIWTVPLAITTLALMAALIVETLMRDTVPARERVNKVTLAIFDVLAVAFLLTFFLDWTCSVIPLVAGLILLGARYTSHKNALQTGTE